MAATIARHEVQQQVGSPGWLRRRVGAETVEAHVSAAVRGNNLCERDMDQHPARAGIGPIRGSRSAVRGSHPRARGDAAERGERTTRAGVAVCDQVEHLEDDVPDQELATARSHDAVGVDRAAPDLNRDWGLPLLPAYFLVHRQPRLKHLSA